TGWHEQNHLHGRTGHLAHQIIERKNSGRYFERRCRRGSSPHHGADREQQATHSGESTHSPLTIEYHTSGPHKASQRGRRLYILLGTALACVNLGANGTQEQTTLQCPLQVARGQRTL